MHFGSKRKVRGREKNVLTVYPKPNCFMLQKSEEPETLLNPKQFNRSVSEPPVMPPLLRPADLKVSRYQRLYRTDRRPKSNQPTKRAAENWPFLRTLFRQSARKLTPPPQHASV